MTNDELDALDRLMAEKVMEWWECKEDPRQSYWEDANHVFMVLDDWHPTTDIAQAMMCAEKAFEGEGFSLIMEPEGVWKVLSKRYMPIVAEDKCEAIVLAIKAAMEEK